ncbi:hypothetical protein [Sphingomonas sp. IC4-52]|nr:hypothetical protein [Sphingomonas sp. IC4-52]
MPFQSSGSGGVQRLVARKGAGVNLDDARHHKAAMPERATGRNPA